MRNENKINTRKLSRKIFYLEIKNITVYKNYAAKASFGEKGEKIKPNPNINVKRYKFCISANNFMKR